MNVRESIARIRRIGEDKETIYVCYVTSADRKLEGVVTVKDLLLSDDEAVIEDIMDTNVIFCRTTDERVEAAERISDYDLLAIPVVDKEAGWSASSRLTTSSTCCRRRPRRTSTAWPVSRPRISPIRARAYWRCGSAGYPG